MAERNRVAVLGAGQHAQAVLSMLELLGHGVTGIYDDREETWETTIAGVPVVGPIEGAAGSRPDGAVIAIGENRARRAVSARVDLPWLTLVHPTAWVDPSSRLGAGTIVFPLAAVHTGTTTGHHSIVNLGALVSHDCILGNYVHIAPGAVIAGGTTIGEAAMIGAGASVAPRTTIGAGALIGIGAAVARGVPDGGKVVGVPPRRIAP